MTWGVVGIRQSSRSWICTLVKLGLTACSVVAQSDVCDSGSLFSLQCEQMVVVGSLLCSERFLSWYSSFSLSSKTNISKFPFDQESGRRRTTLWMCYLQIIIYLFIYLFVVGSVSLEFFIFPALSLHCSLSCSVSTSDMPSQPMTQERMAPNIDWNIILKMHQ